MNKPMDVAYIPMLDYEEAWNRQKAIVQQLDEGVGVEQLLLLQHPPTYTIGSQNHPEHLLLSEEQLREQGISVFQIDRGGDITYHGPGQLVGYPLLVLGRDEDLDLHAYLRRLEQVIIDYLADQGVDAGRKEGYTGVWIGDMKIAAIGVKFNRCKTRRGFVTSHGFAFNVTSGIQHEGFQGIVPCGIEQYGVTSLEDMTGQTYEIQRVAQDIVPYFSRLFSYEMNWISEKEALHRL
ncbi:octanoyltransferase [Paenibacillus sp. Root52]|uniref:Octanoyltransferase n=1 Tax=Paenibacillus amylolyticus TaxID=1451 RepID=A0AAP5H2J5_PAEAM|nr:MULTISPECIES: lipoyl(octanoyl) transferase LipB [Paenibacillus]KQY87883.1 octanoyltransferase [Paenibacillus sp. Root52]MDR6725130.1 lipoyl(octanoyl) transferase [Paenibacillus amylolyticus]